MRIAVTGARGQLGAALIHECAASHQVTAFSHAELDVSNEAAVIAAMATVKPDVILNAAAFTDVDACEDDPIGALNDNAFGVRALARGARGGLGHRQGRGGEWDTGRGRVGRCGPSRGRRWGVDQRPHLIRSGATGGRRRLSP